MHSIRISPRAASKLQPYELYRETVPDEVPERNSPRFATLMGMDTIRGSNDSQDDWHKKWRDRDRLRTAGRGCERGGALKRRALSHVMYIPLSPKGGVR